jgi:hypothetical protein
MAVASLDFKSRSLVKEFAIQVCFGGVITLGACIIGQRSWASGAQLLALIFSASGFISFVWAALSKENINASSLNRWDEALAFTGCSHLLHAVMGYQS